MSASLVGSEMCIRDSTLGLIPARLHLSAKACKRWWCGPRHRELDSMWGSCPSSSGAGRELASPS
eukprot:11950484-Alexandrium_andersonii.AAC.1